MFKLNQYSWFIYSDLKFGEGDEEKKLKKITQTILLFKQLLEDSLKFIVVYVTVGVDLHRLKELPDLLVVEGATHSVARP